MPIADDIILEARALIGVPWVHQGRTEAGLDCVGLICLIARRLGLSEYDVPVYSRDPTSAELLEHFKRAGCRRRVGAEVQAGDIVILRGHLWPQHVGILSTKYGRPHLINAYSVRGKVCEDPLEQSTLDNRVAAFYWPE